MVNVIKLHPWRLKKVERRLICYDRSLVSSSSIMQRERGGIKAEFIFPTWSLHLAGLVIETG